jgi:hypothetical protein
MASTTTTIRVPSDTKQIRGEPQGHTSRVHETQHDVTMDS